MVEGEREKKDWGWRYTKERKEEGKRSEGELHSVLSTHVLLLTAFLSPSAVS